MPILSTTKMTARQFLELGEDPLGVRLELVEGEIAVSPSPIPDHSYVVYFSKPRLYLIGEKAIEGPPDLCVEVISPSSVEIDRVGNFELYRSHKVEHYWIVDPAERTAEGWQLMRGQYNLTSRGQGEAVVKLPPFAGLEIPLAKLWRRKPKRAGE